MGTYIVRRTLLAVFTMLVVSFMSYIILQLPEGDVIDFVIENYTQEFGRNMPPEEIEERRHLFGVDQPVVKQYWDWITGILLRADFGTSYTGYGFTASERTPVRTHLRERVPFTIFLTAFTLFFT